MIWFSEKCSYLLSKTFKSPVTNFKPFNVLKVGFTLKLITVTFILRIKGIPVEVIMLDYFVPWLVTSFRTEAPIPRNQRFYVHSCFLGEASGFGAEPQGKNTVPWVFFFHFPFSFLASLFRLADQIPKFFGKSRAANAVRRIAKQPFTLQKSLV